MRHILIFRPGTVKLLKDYSCLVALKGIIY